MEKSMVTSNLKIELEPRTDKEEQTYYLGRLKFPGTINLSDGVTFLIFTSDLGEEELQIAINNKENSTFSKYSLRNDRIKVDLDEREDQYGKVFYVAKLNLDGVISCKSDLVFLIFLSKKGSEELQIVGDINIDGKEKRNNYRKQNGVVTTVERGKGEREVDICAVNTYTTK